MNKHVLRFLLPLAGIMLLTVSHAHARQAHYPQHGYVVGAAYHFDKSAKRMQRYLRHTLGRSHLTRSARQLSRAARRYRHGLERSESLRYQWQQFEELADRMYDFRREFRHAYLPEPRRGHRAMRRLNRSFRELRHEIRHARHHRFQHRSHGHYRGDHERWPGEDIAVLDDSS